MKNLTRPPLVLIPTYFGCLLFDRRCSRYFPFDQETTQLLRRLVETSLDEVILWAVSRQGHEPGAVIGLVEEFYRRGCFRPDGRLAATVLPLDPPADRLPGPLALHLEVVSACNLTCSHCFAGHLPRRETPLTLVELDRLFGEMSNLGTFRLGLTGGEPLLRGDLFELLDAALGHGLHPCLTTNGLLITDEIARSFGARDLVWLNISLEGATRETNDRVRGEGTFDRVLERIKILRRHSRFTLAFTIMRSNLHEIEDCARLAHDLGAETAVFRPLYPVGTAQSHPELMPTFAEYTDALNRLSRLEVASDLHAIDPFSPQSRSESRATTLQHHGCGAGNLVCSVSVSGDVNPCSFLGTRFNAANLRHHSLEEIWSNSEGFKSIRALPGPDPSHPNQRFSGGCRARSLAFNGSINAPDPWVEAQSSGDCVQSGRHPLVVLDLTASAPRSTRP